MEKKKILVVDDEVGITELVKLYLEQTGQYEVYQENNGSKAFATTQTVMPDLVILDIDMPDMDGSEIAEALRDDAATKNIPIVFLTGIVSEKEAKGRGGIIGGHPFVPKPVKGQSLLDSVERVIQQRNIPK